MVTVQTNKCRLRKLLLGLLISSGCVAVVLIYFIFTFDVEAHRTGIQTLISHALKREVRIDGKMMLERSLSPRIVAEDIRIGNPSWASVPDLACAKRFEIRVALLSLLKRERKILQLNLTGVDVHLEHDQEGTPNWIMGEPGPIILTEVLAGHIEDSTVTLHTKKEAPRTWTIDTLEGTLAINQPIKLVGKLTYKDIPIELSLNGGPLVKKAKMLPLDIKLKAADISARFKGLWENHRQGIAVSGELDFKAAQVTTVGRLFGEDWERNQSVKASGQLDYRGSKLHLRDIKFDTDGADMAGDITYIPDASPRFDIHLKDTVIDLKKYLTSVDKAESGSPAETPTKKDQQIIPEFSLNSDLIKSLSTAIQIENLKVMYDTKHINTFNATLTIVNGVLSLSQFEGRSPTGSSTQASLVLDTTVAPQQAALSCIFKDLDFGLILDNMDIAEGVVGKLNLKLDLKGHGFSLRELLGSADGDLEIVMDKGRIPKRSLELWDGDLVRLLIPTTWFEKDQTDLNCAVGRFVIKDGIMQSNVLLADTKRITVAGETVLDLKTEKVSGLFKPKSKKATFLRYSSPIKVSGTLAKAEAKSANSNFVTVGKMVIALAHPTSLIVLFGNLGSKEKNPCAALLHHPLPDSQPEVAP